MKFLMMYFIENLCAIYVTYVILHTPFVFFKEYSSVCSSVLYKFFQYLFIGILIIRFVM